MIPFFRILTLWLDFWAWYLLSEYHFCVIEYAYPCVSLKLDQNKLYMMYSFYTLYWKDFRRVKKYDSCCLRYCFKKIIESQALSLVSLLHVIFMYLSKFYKLNVWFCRNSAGILKRQITDTYFVSQYWCTWTCL